MTLADDFGEVDYRINLTGLVLEGRYHVVSVLGRGSSSVVYLAFDTRSFDRRVVIKVPGQELLGEEGFKESFYQELRTLAKLEHPHIVKVLEAGDFKGLPYGVFQYMSGGSLLQQFAATDGNLSIGQILSWLPHVASALDFIHEHNFVHTDVKPENILFDSAGNVYLSDFVIARAMTVSQGGKNKMGALMIRSPQYVPPDALDPKNIGPSYDQYALGVVVYQMLSGRFTHEWDMPAELLFRKLTELPTPLSKTSAKVSHEVSQVVMKSLSSDPFERYASCEEFSEAFKEAADWAPPKPMPVRDPTMRDSVTSLFLANEFLPNAEKQSSPLKVAPIEESPQEEAETEEEPASEPEPEGALKSLWMVLILSGGVLMGLVFALSILLIFGKPSEWMKPTDEVATQETEETPTPENAVPPVVELLPTQTPTPEPSPTIAPTLTPEVDPSSASLLPTASPEPTATPVFISTSMPKAGWILDGNGWSLDGETQLEAGATLTSEQSYALDYAVLLKAQRIESQSIFGLKAFGNLVHLEYRPKGGFIRVMNMEQPLAEPWPDANPHQLTLIFKKNSVTAYLDKTKLAEFEGVQLPDSGNTTLFCEEGAISFRNLDIRSLKLASEQ